MKLKTSRVLGFCFLTICCILFSILKAGDKVTDDIEIKVSTVVKNGVSGKKNGKRLVYYVKQGKEENVAKIITCTAKCTTKNNTYPYICMELINRQNNSIYKSPVYIFSSSGGMKRKNGECRHI